MRQIHNLPIIPLVVALTTSAFAQSARTNPRAAWPAARGVFHTLSRSGRNPVRVQWDLDVQREIERKSIDHIRASVTLQNPRVFRGSDKGRGYGVSAGNCAGFTRDAWHFYSGEWYELPSPPSAAALRELVLRRHPQQPAKVYSTRLEQNRQARPSRGR
jgi:hypothetical protein